MENFESHQNNEEIIDNGLGILFKKKTLYHGSPVAQIQKLNPAEETTVGEGVYFTSDRKAAEGYARVRSMNKQEAVATVYKADIENLKFADLTKEENLKKVLEGFLPVLVQERDKEGVDYLSRKVINNAVEAIVMGKVSVGNLRSVAFGCGWEFTSYLKSLGYDGLITLEGGERDIGSHDTYLVFDSEKLENVVPAEEK
jgi:hypothetical protein